MNNDRSASGLWLGFVIGSIFGIATSYFIGTKQGRKTLKEFLITVDEYEETLKKSFSKALDEIKDILTEPDVADLLREEVQSVKKLEPSSSLSIKSIIDKIKQNTL